jgi:P27 family predicted phage terminase small subunit
LKLRGTYRADRHEATKSVPTVARIPRAPSYLTTGARREWSRIVRLVFDLAILTPLDLGALAAFAMARDRALEAEREVARDGATIETPQGRRRHPALLTLERAWADVRRYESLFGLNPSARRSLRMSETTPIEVAKTAQHQRFFGTRTSPAK